jgi:anaerobic glycerol-3-phosphate dehydrogenase
MMLTHGDTAVVRRERMRGHFMETPIHPPSLPGLTRQSIVLD